MQWTAGGFFQQGLTRPTPRAERAARSLAEDRPGDAVTFDCTEEPPASFAAADGLMIPQGNFRFAFRMENPKHPLSSSLLPFNQLPDQ